MSSSRRKALASPRAADVEPLASLVAALSREANLGVKSAHMLIASGVTSFAQVRQLGSVATYIRVKQAGQPASLNLLWALEGAVSGVHWQVIAREHRTSLLLALEQAQNGA